MTQQLQQPVSDGRPPRPSGRQYYLWQIGMWVTILHAALLGPLAAWGVATQYRIGGFRDAWYVAMAGIPSHLKVAYWLVRGGEIAAVACVLAAPLAVIGCHLRSMGRRGWGWMRAYWSVTGVLFLLPIMGGAMFPDHLMVAGAFGWFTVCSPGLGGVFLSGFVPLLVTLAVAVLARQGREGSASGPHPFGE